MNKLSKEIDAKNKGISKSLWTSRKARNRKYKALDDAISMEMLEGRRLFTTLSITDFGANGSNGADARSAFQAALNAAKPGDTVNVPSGTFNISGSLNVPSGVTITGMGANSSHVNFTLTNGDLYGFVLNANDSNVTISNLDLHSAHGILGGYYGSNYANLTITNDALQFGGGSTSNGTEVMGIYMPVGSTNLQITHNYFHDSLSSNRDWEIWYATGAQLNYNTMYKIDDGGHLDEPQANCSFSYNYGTDMVRMGQEIQGGSPTTGLRVVGNTFYNWLTPYYNTFGLSVMNNKSTGTVVSNNYISATIAPGSTYGQADGGGVQRFGFAIEAGGFNFTIENNTIIGPWTEGVSASNSNVLVENNKKYGGSAWGDYVGEPGDNGSFGSVIVQNSPVDQNVNDAPAPPANTNNFTGGQTITGSTSSTTTTTTSSGSTGSTSTGTGSTTTSTPVTTPTTPTITASGINGLVVTVLSDTSVKLTWTNASTLTGALVDILSTVGRQQFASVAVADGATSATITGLHAGWQLDFEVTGKTSTGTAVNSAAVTAQMTGDPMASYSATPALLSTSSTSTGTSTTGTSTTTTGSTTTATGSTTTTGSTSTTGSTANGITGITATVLSDNSVQLSWTSSKTLTSAQVSIITSVGRQTFTPVTVNGNVSSITIGNLHAGWQFDFEVTGTASDGSTVTSDTVTSQMTGDYNATPANSPSAIASTLVPSTTTTTTTTAANASISNLVATVLSDTSVQLSWTDTGTDQASAQIGVVTTVGRQTYPTISATGSSTTAVITGLHAGWQFDFTLTVTNAAGQTVVSNPLTVMTTGSPFSSSVLANLSLKLSSSSSLLAA